MMDDQAMDLLHSDNSSSSEGNLTSSSSRMQIIRKEVNDDIPWDDAQDNIFDRSGNTEIAKSKFGLYFDEKLLSKTYSKDFTREMSGSEMTIAHFQKEGFNNPVLVKDKEGLGLRVPNVGVHDIRAQVGSRRYIDVMDVSTQKINQLTMKEFNKYWDSPPETRKQLLNVLSLEFSNTKLDAQVVAPKIVRQIDWIDKVWPRHLKEMQIESTNSIDDMMYPKVQKYCIMSVKDSWTDFHIDLGGTSVWYHILQGKKVFWLVPPSDDNLKRYELWVLEGKKVNSFFGDQVDNCCRITVEAGNTFFIPSGWIHAVFTPEDSIVFGGHFLHSFNIERQLQVSHIEELTHIPNKFRFPFFTEMLWYTLDRYIHCLMGHTHLDLPEEEKRRIRLEKGDNIDPNKEFLKLDAEGGIHTPREHVHMTQAELHGLKFIIMYLHLLSASKKNVPILLPDPIALVQDIRKLVLSHKDDCPDVAVNGKYILRWNENDDVDSAVSKKFRRPKGTHDSIAASSANDYTPPVVKGKPGRKPKASMPEVSTPKQPKKLTSGNRRRRVRCKNCEACLGSDCKQCSYCKDMTKYGGPGRMKQTCERRRCLHPQLPICAYCSECKLDGWYNEPKLQVKETERPDEPPKLYECTVCLDIMHPDCAEKKMGLGKINNDLSNSWECARCLNQGFPVENLRGPQAGGKRRGGGDERESSKKGRTDT